MAQPDFAPKRRPDMATHDPDKDSPRSAIILVIVMIAIAAFALLRGLQTVAWLESKMWASANPWLRDVPQPLPAPPPAASAPLPAPTPLTNKKVKGANPIQEIKIFDYEFASPWGDAAITPGLTHAQLLFKPGQVIVFWDPHAQLDTVSMLRTSTSPAYQNFARLAGGTIGTNYALYQAVYAASPAQVSPFVSTNAALRLHLLLLLKLGFGFDEKPPVYSFAGSATRGFQFGGPAGGRPVAVRAFDSRDHQFRFIFIVTPGSGAKISQAEINGIVQSLQPVPLDER